MTKKAAGKADAAPVDEVAVEAPAKPKRVTKKAAGKADAAPVDEVAS